MHGRVIYIYSLYLIYIYMYFKHELPATNGYTFYSRVFNAVGPYT